MGDFPPPASGPNDYAQADGVPSPLPGANAQGQPLHPTQSSVGTFPAHGYAQSYTNPQTYAHPQHAFSSQLDMAQSSGPAARGNVYNMSAMTNALSQQQQQYRPGQFSPNQQRFSPPSASTSTMQSYMPVHQQQQQQYEPQGGVNAIPNQAYYVAAGAAHPAAAYYSTAMSPPHSQNNVATRSNMGPYQSAVVIPQQATVPTGYYYPQTHYGTPPGNHPGNHFGYLSQGPMGPSYLSSTPPQSDPRMVAPQQTDQYAISPYSQSRGSVSSENRQNIVRGPPRKPRQSGHAIWIGNLPPQTELMSLVQHVCKEAPGLESLFLISKSNCAFANFKDEASCVAAQQKLHDSRFMSVRLVSRLRKNTVEGVSGITAPTEPAAMQQSAGAEHAAADASQRTDGGADTKEDEQPSTAKVETQMQSGTPTLGPDGGESMMSPPQKDKYFILKSLTMEDLQLSVQTGIWATQSHNEEVLNKAFATAENVYLIFSANKSGEYFGYARMMSPINDDPAAAIEFAPKAQQATADLDLPKAIPTEPTEYAPKGQIIDDSARGTIFWEAEREEGSNTLEIPGQDGGEEGNSSGPGSTGDTSSVQSEGGGKTEAKAWGKPFKLEWLSTNKLPFFRARGLRNPWNSNREVKIARDGTELEPSVGRRLIGLFARVQTGQYPSPRVGVGHGVMGMPAMPMVQGYQTMRPPYQGP